MAPHSSSLAWKIPWTEEPGRLQSIPPARDAPPLAGTESRGAAGSTSHPAALPPVLPPRCPFALPSPCPSRSAPASSAPGSLPPSPPGPGPGPGSRAPRAPARGPPAVRAAPPRGSSPSGLAGTAGDPQASRRWPRRPDPAPPWLAAGKRAGSWAYS